MQIWCVMSFHSHFILQSDAAPEGYGCLLDLARFCFSLRAATKTSSLITFVSDKDNL